MFPPHCVGCDRVGSFLCSRCLAQFTPPDERVVPGLDGICVCAAYEGPAGAAVRALKYDDQPRLAEPLGGALAAALRRTGWQVDLLVPVPLHDTRFIERGYNQAKLISLYAARALGIPAWPEAVTRVRATASQVHLNADERRKNVEGAFAAAPDFARDRHVVVIDDVLTTGATIAACAAALRAAGAAHVYGAAVAGAVFSPEPAAGMQYSPV